jgi:uncharacterized membrane protein
MKRWWLFFAVCYGVFVGMPFLAPVLMHLNLQSAGRLVYLIYGFLCHQLPQRSLFFFGPESMYTLAEIQTVWQNSQDPLLLRQFIGNANLGWKVAWSDRMISVYGGVWLFGVLWRVARVRVKAISIWAMVGLALPLALDGVTHFISDLGGLSAGFRYTNDWLALITANAFPASFYLGDSLGSFNSLMRWITGLLFSLGLVWWAFPYIDGAARCHSQGGDD